MPLYRVVSFSQASTVVDIQLSSKYIYIYILGENEQNKNKSTVARIEGFKDPKRAYTSVGVSRTAA